MPSDPTMTAAQAKATFCNDIDDLAEAFAEIINIDWPRQVAALRAECERLRGENSAALDKAERERDEARASLTALRDAVEAAALGGTHLFVTLKHGLSVVGDNSWYSDDQREHPADALIRWHHEQEKR